MNNELLKEIQEEIENERKNEELYREKLYYNIAQGLDPDKLIICASYPQSPEYDYSTKLVNLDLEEECRKGIESGRDFIITNHQPIQKEVKAIDGIFSPLYGQNLSDMEPFMDRWRCVCGKTKHAVNEGTICPHCGFKVKFVDDDFGCFGWLKLNSKKVIHPNLYKNIETMVGYPQTLINILDLAYDVDEDGHEIEVPIEENMGAREGNAASNKRLKNVRRKVRGKAPEPFYGKGMVWFRENFDMVMDYYYKNAANKANKKPVLDKIYQDINKVFTSCIPVYTTHLRPFNITKGNEPKLDFEGTNANYNMMSKLVYTINKDKLQKDNNKKKMGNQLWSLQREWNDLYAEIDVILSGKKGNVRLLSGGRCNFSGGAVIIQDPSLRTDQVTLPYAWLVITLEQQIVNTLVKTYGMTYNAARNRWFRAIDEPDKNIINHIYLLLKSRPEGLAILINRNPTIQRGGLLQMFCVDMTFNYTMALPLSILDIMGADFDGDRLNIFYIISEAFFKRCYQVINPRNSMCISNNDGKSNSSLLPYKDTLINSNTLLNLGRKTYTIEQFKRIEAFKIRNNII